MIPHRHWFDSAELVIVRVQFINKPVQIIECQQSEAPLDLILGINAFNLERMLELDPEFKVCRLRGCESGQTSLVRSTS